jgi:hypothetical protein
MSFMASAYSPAFLEVCRTKLLYNPKTAMSLRTVPDTPTKWNDMANIYQDYMQFIKEKRNGLYGATAMIVSNFLIGIPYLCMSSVSLSPLPHTD